MKITITTGNAMYKNGECVGGYHEIHEVNYLQNVEHAIATIDSVIKNNLMYGCIDTVLESVEVLCENIATQIYIEEYFKTHFCKVKVYISVR